VENGLKEELPAVENKLGRSAPALALSCPLVALSDATPSTALLTGLASLLLLRVLLL